MVLLYYQIKKKTQNSINIYPFSHWFSFITFCLLNTGLTLFSTDPAFCQNDLLEKTITIPSQRTTLYEALNLISKKADCLFIYDSETVENDKRVRLYANNQPLGQVLENLLSNPALGYKLLGKHILIYNKTLRTPENELQPSVFQTDTIKNVVIKGHVFDNVNKTAIPFATIGIVEENLGAISNNDGFFSIKIPASLIGTSLIVSHLGYISQRIPVQLLQEQQVDFYLNRRVISIQEVIIRYIDPKEIIAKAMDQRKLNYAVDPVYLTAFYREGVQKNEKYISYSEAVFKVFKSPWNAGEHSDQVKLLKSRKVQDLNPRDTVYLKLKAGVQSALQLDLVKNVPGFIDPEPPVEYTYTYSDLISYQSKDAYAITFVQNDHLKKALYSGTLYVETASFAILGADFEINPKYLDIAAEELVLKKSPKVKVKLEKITYSVSYMPFNGRYYLRHARCEIKLKTRLKHHLFTDHFTTFLELATCNIDTTAVVKFPRQETLKPNVVFSDQPYNMTDDFWGDVNRIKPEVKLEEALSQIVGKIEEMTNEE